MRELAAVIAAPADTHSGSIVGLMPPEWTLEDETVIVHNAARALIWRQWLEGWERVAALRVEAAHWPRLLVIHNGDAVDGDHHGTAELVTQRIDEQERMHASAMGTGLKLAGWDPERGDEIRYVAGTFAHVGEGASSEERIARMLLNGAKADGKAVVHRVLRRRIAGVLVKAVHHGPPPGARAWTWDNPLRWKLRSDYLLELERGDPITRFHLWAHRHQFVPAEVRRRSGELACEGFLLPSFTLKTDFANKVAPESLANVGMWIGKVYTDGSADWECPRIAVQPEPIVEDAVDGGSGTG